MFSKSGSICLGEANIVTANRIEAALDAFASLAEFTGQGAPASRFDSIQCLLLHAVSIHGDLSARPAGSNSRRASRKARRQADFERSILKFGTRSLNPFVNQETAGDARLLARE